MFRKLNVIEKYLLKYQDKEAYNDYKFLKKLQDLTHPETQAQSKNKYTFKHSGNAGDIIYSLPALYALAENKPAEIYLHTNQKGIYGNRGHPLGDVMLNEKIVEFIKPLLLKQPQITLCEAYCGQPIDYDLDLFRKYPFNLANGNIARWYFLIFAVNADLGKPWLSVVPDNSFKDAVVIARSNRYHAPGISYNFLNNYSRTVFLGLEDEYFQMKKMIASIEYKPVKDFLEMASVIAGSKLFIGNQSFPFSIAEALKVKRLLEFYHQSPNVNVEGIAGYDFCFQPQFEKLVSRIMKDNENVFNES